MDLNHSDLNSITLIQQLSWDYLPYFECKFLDECRLYTAKELNDIFGRGGGNLRNDMRRAGYDIAQFEEFQARHAQNARDLHRENQEDVEATIEDRFKKAGLGERPQVYDKEFTIPDYGQHTSRHPGFILWLKRTMEDVSRECQAKGIKTTELEFYPGSRLRVTGRSTPK
jgi:hypothetical protein